MPEEGWHRYLYDNNIDDGICYCASFQFDYNIYDSDFSKEFTSGKAYLCEPTGGATSYSEAKKLLQIRLDRLKEFVK